MDSSSGISYSASSSSNLTSGQTGLLLVLDLLFIVFFIVVMWKIFSKAGYAGWKSLIPFYNFYIELKIAGLNPWLMLGLLVPFLNIVVFIMLALGLAKSFGRSPLFGILGLALFSPVGMSILAFGKSTYVGPGGEVFAAPNMSAPEAANPPVAPVA